jgi:hypothetical protein
MKIIALLAFLAVPCLLSGQNLIGYKDFEIRKFMKENKSDMNFNKVTNNSFNYLKYTDNSDSQTILFFLNGDTVCNSIRIICDQGEKYNKIKEYNAVYKKNGDNKWIDRRNGKDYLIEIKDEKWSSVITINSLK